MKLVYVLPPPTPPHTHTLQTPPPNIHIPTLHPQFSTGCSKAVTLLQSVVSGWRLFCRYLFLNSRPFGASGRLYFVNVAFPISTITITCLYNVDSLKQHFYIVKLGFTGVYIIFLIFARKRKQRLWVLVRTASPRRFLRVPQSMFWAEIWKISEFLFLSEDFSFWMWYQLSYISFLLNRKGLSEC